MQYGNPFNLNLKKIIAVLLLGGFLIGGITGGVAGFIIGNMAKESPNWPFLEKEVSKKEEVKSEEDRVISSIEKVSPAVVSIIISKDLSELYKINTNPFPFGDLFGLPFEIPEPEIPEGEQEVGGGTGFIISSDGLILTNRHVVSDEDASYTIITNDGREYEAEVLAKDTVDDIAIIKIDASDLPVAELGDSDNIKIGETVIAIGNALSEFKNTATKGIISGKNRTIRASGSTGSTIIEGAIQTDAAINPGNSGGPLIDLEGKVVGINTAIHGSGQLIGFAIPVNSAKSKIRNFQEHGRIVRPFLGVRYVPINEAIAKANDLEMDYGAWIVSGKNEGEEAVVPESPAQRAGIVENDIILEVEGKKITEDHGLTQALDDYSPGDDVDLKILREGEEQTITVNLEEFKQK